jgi:hypothetical protein
MSIGRITVATGFAQVDSVLLRSFFVAERRLNLARPFKAGIEKESQPRRVSDD